MSPTRGVPPPFAQCPACRTHYNPRLSSPTCPHASTVREAPLLKALREQGAPYKHESWKAGEAARALEEAKGKS
jgi:hypothetical protein